MDQARAANLVSDMDLLRLKAAARLFARGLAPEIQWWDLLQERALLAQQESEAIAELFADDAVALQVLTGLADAAEDAARQEASAPRRGRFTPFKE